MLGLDIRFRFKESRRLEASSLTLLEAIHDLPGGSVRQGSTHVAGIRVDQIGLADGPGGTERGARLAQRIGGHFAVGANGALESFAGFGALAGWTAVVVILWIYYLFNIL